jgi:hypothetical protein
VREDKLHGKASLKKISGAVFVEKHTSLYNHSTFIPKAQEEIARAGKKIIFGRIIFTFAFSGQFCYTVFV